MHGGQCGGDGCLLDSGGAGREGAAMEKAQWGGDAGARGRPLDRDGQAADGPDAPHWVGRQGGHAAKVQCRDGLLGVAAGRG